MRRVSRWLPAGISLVVLALAPTARGEPGAAGNLLVVSQGSQQILEYSGSTGAFDGVFVEPITVGFQNPGGMALRPGSGALTVSSAATGEIWTYTTASGAAAPPATATGLIQPGAIAFDAAGSNLYVLDALTGLSTATDAVKRVVMASGVVSNVGSDETASFRGLAIQGSFAYASDALGGRVVRFPVSGGSGTAVITGLSLPAGLLFRSATQLLVAEAGTDRVLEYTWNGSAWVFLRVVLAASAGVDGPAGLALAPDGRLSVSGSFSNQVEAVDLTTLAVSLLVAPGAAGLSAARDLAWSGSTLLAASPGSNAILYYDAAGAPTGVTARGISAPTDAGMVVAPLGEVFAASQTDNDVAEYAASGAALRTYFDACPTALAAPFDVAVGPDGDLYVSCEGSDAIHRFETATGTSLGFFVSGGCGGLALPRGLVFAPNGDLLVASGLTGEILAYDGAGCEFAGVFVDSGGNGGGPIDPWGLVVHQGRLLVASRFPSRVEEFDADTGDFVQTLVASGSGGLAGPTALAFGPDGDLYVTSFEDDAVRRYDGTSGAFVSVFVAGGAGGLDGPIDLGFRPAAVAAVPALGPLARVVVAVLLLASAFLGYRTLVGSRATPGPAPVVDGEKVVQVLPDAEGRPQLWTLERREVPREQLPELVLPRPEPRASPPDAGTDSARALDARALEAWRHGDVAEALELFEAAIQADPDDVVPRSNYGRLLVLMTANEQAYPHLERAAQLSPDEPQVWVDLLNFYERAVLLERAGYARQRVEELSRGTPLVRDEETGLWTLGGTPIFP